MGEDGARAALILAQDAVFDPRIRSDALRLLGLAVASGEADAEDLAVLTDRARLAEGRPQVYGTILGLEIEDPEHVDDRRREVGLPPIGAGLRYFDHRPGPVR